MNTIVQQAIKPLENRIQNLENIEIPEIDGSNYAPWWMFPVTFILFLIVVVAYSTAYPFKDYIWGGLFVGLGGTALVAVIYKLMTKTDNTVCEHQN